jgi:hypothetical protein
VADMTSTLKPHLVRSFAIYAAKSCSLPVTLGIEINFLRGLITSLMVMAGVENLSHNQPLILLNVDGFFHCPFRSNY